MTRNATKPEALVDKLLKEYTEAAALLAIYAAATLAAAAHALKPFAERWDTKYPTMSPSWLAA